MTRHEVQQEVRQAIVVSDQLSRFAHQNEEPAASAGAASVRTTLNDLERQLGRRSISPLFAKKLDKTLARLIKACESMGPDHQAQAASLVSQAQLLRMEVQEASVLFTPPGEEVERSLLRVSVCLFAGTALFALSMRGFVRQLG